MPATTIASQNSGISHGHRERCVAPVVSTWAHSPYGAVVLAAGDYMYTAPPMPALPACHWSDAKSVDADDELVRPSSRPLPRPLVLPQSVRSSAASSMGATPDWRSEPGDQHHPGAIYDISLDESLLGADDVEGDAVRSGGSEQPKQFIVALVVAFRKLHFFCDFPVVAGEPVVYECDRGVGIANVVGVFLEKPPEIRNARILLHVLRRPTAEEMHEFCHVMPHEREVALAFCRMQTIRLRVPLEIIDCEVRFDRSKVTFQYRALAGQRVPFVSLLKAVHGRFRTRVWMDDVDRLYELDRPARTNNGIAHRRGPKQPTAKA